MSNNFKQRLLDFLAVRIKYAVGPKKAVYEKLEEILPSEIIVNKVSEELDEVIIRSGSDDTKLNFHWEKKESLVPTKPNFQRFYLKNID